MTKKELASTLKNGMFADRDTIKEAYHYALSVAPHGGVYLQTALHVLMNTIAKEIENLED